ncbi:hypothetical protein BDW59DRAFT_139419 [Aspergillus cavernicola]|uniref:Hypervirulence associated protein TUDOR domain-containing protein n=1 Tax=Aspergillus cavernicola TaxID=176166 RepID=A0ABR4J0E2_9EURO
MPRYSNGQMVEYKPIGGRDSNTSVSTGKVMSVLTEAGRQAERNVEATKDKPRYEIENSNTGKRTSVFEDNILGEV